MPKIRRVRCYGYRSVGDGVKNKKRYMYTRKAFFFPVALDKELIPFLAVELTPHIEEGHIILEPRKPRSNAKNSTEKNNSKRPVIMKRRITLSRKRTPIKVNRAENSS